jgi:concanavalin A-like lectin/glucanase superfamily protein
MRPILTKPVLVVPASAHAREDNPQIGTGPVSTLVRAIGEAVGAAAVFSPDDLAGLEAWYKADAITGLADADPVATWIDSSGNGRDATQATEANKPTYQTAELNGLPIVRFDGTDDFLRNTAFYDFADEYTVFTVAAFASVADTTQALLEVTTGSVNTGFSVLFDANGDKWIVQDSTGGVAVSIAGGNDGIFRQRTGIVRGSASESQFYRNGTSIGTATYTSPNANLIDVIDIGRLAGLESWSFNGDIAEIIMYSRALSDTERQQVEDYLMDKYAL